MSIINQPITRNSKPRLYYSTGQIARLINCNARTVGKWVDRGALPGARMPDGARARSERRIHHDDLLAFLLANGYHREAAILRGEAEPETVLLVGVAVPLVERTMVELAYLADADATAPRLLRAETGFEAGRLFQAHRPRVVVLDMSAVGRAATHAIGDALALCDPRPAVVYLLPEDCRPEFFGAPFASATSLVQPVLPAHLALALAEALYPNVKE